MTALLNSSLNGNRRRFCNSPCISSSACPSQNTFRPNSRAPSSLRNRDKALRLYKHAPALQISSRTPCICTVKMASTLSPSFFLLLHYTPSRTFSQAFSLTKLLFRLKNCQKILQRLDRNARSSPPNPQRLPA